MNARRELQRVQHPTLFRHEIPNLQTSIMRVRDNILCARGTKEEAHVVDVEFIGREANNHRLGIAQNLPNSKFISQVHCSTELGRVI